MARCSDRCVDSYLLVLLAMCCCNHLSSAGGYSEHAGRIDITLPPSSTATETACLGYRVPDDEYYIVKFEAVSDLPQADEIMLYACEEAEEDYRKNCQSVCGAGDSRLIYVWAPFTQTFQTLPKDAGFAIGRGTIAKYLVIQVHYSSPVAGDKSGVSLGLTDLRPVYVAGIYVLVASQGTTIQAGSKEVNVDVSCKLTSDDVLHFFAFRAHTHSLGRHVTGYKVNNTWHVMGHTNPQSAQLFHLMSTEFEVTKDDFLVARCNYDATGSTHDTVVGYTFNNEMCNLYLMFYANSTPAAGSKSRAAGSKSPAAGSKWFYDCSGNNFPQLTSNIPPLNSVDINSPTQSRDVAKFMVHDHHEHFEPVGRPSSATSSVNKLMNREVEEELDNEPGVDGRIVTDSVDGDERTVLRKDTADNSTLRSLRKMSPGQRRGNPVVQDYSAFQQRNRNRRPVEKASESQLQGRLGASMGQLQGHQGVSEGQSEGQFSEEDSANKQHSPEQTELVDRDSKDLLHSDVDVTAAAAAATSTATTPVVQDRESSSSVTLTLLTTPTVSTLPSTLAPSTSMPTVPTSASDLKTVTGVHQSVKKGGVVPHYLSDSNTDQTAGDNIDKKVTQSSIVGASLIVGMLIAVPLSVAIVVTVCTRLRKNGKLSDCGAERRHKRRSLNLGDLLSRGRHNGNIGFHYLSSMDEEYHDELDPLRSEESEVEEFSSSAAAAGAGGGGGGLSTQRNA